MTDPNQPQATEIKPHRRRYLWLLAALAGAGLLGSAAVSQSSIAQDDVESADQNKSRQVEIKTETRTIRVPKVVTSYREERVGDTVRRVPVQSTVFEERRIQQPVSAGVMFSGATPAGAMTAYSYRIDRPELPHNDEIGPLVEQILRRRSTLANSDDETAVPSRLDGQLLEMLGDQFDAMHERQAAEMEKLEKRLKTLREQHETRAEAREEIIARRMNQLLRQPDPLAWDPNAKLHPRPGLQGRSLWVAEQQLTSPGTIVVPATPPSPTGTSRKHGSTQSFRIEKRPSPPRPPVPPVAPANPSRFANPIQSPQPAPPKPDAAQSRQALPGMFQMQLRSRQLSDEPLAKAINELYAAIGRVSTERNEVSLDQLNQAVRMAERAIVESKEASSGLEERAVRIRELEKQLEETQRVLKAAEAMADRRAAVQVRRAIESAELERRRREEVEEEREEAAADGVEDVQIETDVEVRIFSDDDEVADDQESVEGELDAFDDRVEEAIGEEIEEGLPSDEE